MENKVIVISEMEFLKFLRPLIERLDRIESILSNSDSSKVNSTYSDAEAATYLKMSSKKLQSLRNARKIGFIREDGGRKVTYTHEHLLTYLTKYEFKAKK